MKDLETLVFPNDADNEDWLTISVTVKRADNITFTKKYRIPSSTSGDKPFRFLSNHEYVLQLTVMTDDVRIIAIVPQKYDWIAVDDDEQIVGTPMVFANTIWLDRNLGANTYDITDTESFNKSVGFFYQTCRNIPYWPFCWNLKIEHYGNGTPKAEDRFEVPLSQGNVSWSKGDYRPYPIVSDRLQPSQLNIATDQWTHNNDGGERAYTILEPEEANKPTFSFVVGEEWDKWWSENTKQAETQNRDLVDYEEFWNDPADQPVPKGWAIPTKEQFMSIFPGNPFAGNVAFFNRGNNSNPSNWCPYSEGDDAIFTKDIEVIRFCVPYYKDGGKSWHQHMDKGDIKDQGCIPAAEKYMEKDSSYKPNHNNNKDQEPEGDPSPGYRSVYIISRKDGDKFDFTYKYKDSKVKEVGTIYGIKKVGTSEAYRMRWKIHDATANDSKATRPLLYVAVSIYPATKDDNLTTENFKDFNWDNPSASMNFPLSGLIDGKNGKRGMFCNYGSEVMYATSTVNGNKSGVLRMKVWGNDNRNNTYIAVVDELVNHGKQIRLIRE